MTRRCLPTGCIPAGCTRVVAATTVAAMPASSGVVTPSSAPAVCTSRGFFDESCLINGNGSSSNTSPGFELNVNVACSPAGNRGMSIFDLVESLELRGRHLVFNAEWNNTEHRLASLVHNLAELMLSGYCKKHSIKMRNDVN